VHTGHAEDRRPGGPGAAPGQHISPQAPGEPGGAIGQLHAQDHQHVRPPGSSQHRLPVDTLTTGGAN